MDKSSHKIICTAFSNGRRHDFRLFKESKTFVHPSTEMLADSGYQGLQRLHNKTRIPKKKRRDLPISEEDKKANSRLASDRVLNENVIAMIKRFKIISDRYRNRRKRFGLRFNLIAALYNWELNKTSVSKEV